MNEFYLIGSEKDRGAMEELRSAITAEGYTLNIVCQDVDNESLDNSIGASKVVLWLSPNTEMRTFEVAQKRRNNNLQTVNIFADSIQLSAEQKKCVGRNRSVFATLTQNVAAELLTILGSAKPLAVEKAAPVVKETPELKSETADVATRIFPKEESVVVEESDVENTDEKIPTAYKPWKAFLVMIAVYVVEYSIEDAHQFYNDEVLPYILFAACAFVEWAAAGGVLGWRQRNGKSFFSTLVMWVGGFLGLFYAWLFVKNLWNFIF